MPTRSSSGYVTTYDALPPPKRQQTFPARRKSVKAKAATPRLSKDQSTLTQLDFFPSSSSRSDMTDMSSDEDFEDPRPKKKQRKSKSNEKQAGQSTLTQFDRTLSGRKAPPEFELDEDGFQIWEDPHEEVQIVEAEIPETSQLDMQSTWEENADATHATVGMLTKLRTPNKVKFVEVPSSQTPPSTVESVQTIKRTRNVEGSPLKQKSANIQPAPSMFQQSPESQNVSMKMLERVRLQTKKVPLNDVAEKYGLPEIMTATHADIDATPKPRPQTRPPVFKQTSTIQDSQCEGASLSTVSSKESIGQPVRKLQRVSTIQDSQFDTDDLLSDPNRLAGDEDEHLIWPEESQFPLEDTQHGYFDPVNSALDRDASRFRWTQTQKQLSHSKEEESDAETDDGDLDRGRMEHTATRIGISGSGSVLQDDAKAPTSGTAEIEELDRLQSITKPPAALLEARRPQSRDDSAYESSDHANKEDVLVLSSSPPLRSSQISTFVPTQASALQTVTQSENILSARPTNHLVEPATLPISPYKPIHYFEALSSSPFPVAPWSSPQKPPTQSQTNESSSPLRKSQLPKLVDYSLPPPPALSSSGRGTPASSSR